MDYRTALETVWNVFSRAKGTGGARVCAGVILGLYNGRAFPFDLTDLKLVPDYQNALLNLIAGNLGSRNEIHIDIMKTFGDEAWDKFLNEYK